MRKTTCIKLTTSANLSLISLTCSGRALTYTLNEKTIPEFGKIFCFKTVDDAQAYLPYLHKRFPYVTKYNMFEGIGENPTIQKYVLHPTYIDVKDFWKFYQVAKNRHVSIKTYTEVRESSAGTIGVDAFTPTKLIE